MVSILIMSLITATANLPTKQAEPENTLTFEDLALCGLPFFLSEGIIIDIDSLAAIRTSGAASFPGELLRRLQAKDAKERAAALRTIYWWPTMAQTIAWIDRKSDGARLLQQALGRLASSYEKALVGCLKDPSDEIRFRAGMTLLVLEPNNKEALQAMVAGLRTMDVEFLKMIWPLRFTHGVIIACLVDALGSKEAKIRRAAAVAVMEIGAPAKAAVPALVDLLKSNEAVDYDFRPWPFIAIFSRRANLALEALGVMGPGAAPAVPTLIEMLKTSEDQERGDILICLARIGPVAQKAVLAIRQLLNSKVHPYDPNQFRLPAELEIRLGAACTLLQILPEDEQALSVVQTCLRDSDKKLRLSTLEACVRAGLKEKALVPGFIRALKDKDLKEAAANALAAVGPDAKEAIPALLEALMNERSNHTNNHEAARALVAIGPAGLRALIKVAEQHDSAARSAAIFALSHFDGETQRTLPIFINALADDHSRISATVALGKLGNKARQAYVALRFIQLLDFLRTDEELLLLDRWALRQVSKQADHN